MKSKRLSTALSVLCYASATVLLVITPSVSATWYEATGQAVILDGNEQQARQAAIEDAVKRAALFAGASLSSTQHVTNGILQSEQLALTSDSEIKQLNIVSETSNGKVITITVRADIYAQKASCDDNQYKKTLLLANIDLQQRQDAVYGQLFKLGDNATNQLLHHLRDYSPATVVNSVNYVIAPHQLSSDYSEQLFKQGTQYVLTARINDLSLGRSTNRFWQPDSKERFFGIDVSLFDVFEQTVVYQQEYRSSAGWPYSDKTTPASHSQAFWQMEYGQKIDRVLQAIAEDVQQQLQCQPLLSNIMQVNNNQLMLALGEQHGIQSGDSLTLYQLQRHPTSPEVKRLIKSPIELTVTDVTLQHAWASNPQNKLIQHIQPGDIVSVRKNSR